MGEYDLSSSTSSSTCLVLQVLHGRENHLGEVEVLVIKVDLLDVANWGNNLWLLVQLGKLGLGLGNERKLSVVGLLLVGLVGSRLELGGVVGTVHDTSGQGGISEDLMVCVSTVDISAELRLCSNGITKKKTHSPQPPDNSELTLTVDIVLYAYVCAFLKNVTPTSAKRPRPLRFLLNFSRNLIRWQSSGG